MSDEGKVTRRACLSGGNMLRRLLRPTAAVAAGVAIGATMPVAAIAASGYFTSSSASSPAVRAVNSSGGAGAKAVSGVESATGGNQRYGIYGSASGAGGIGVWGHGAKYGVYSNGSLGIASGDSLKCAGCVSRADLGPVPAARVWASSCQVSNSNLGQTLAYDNEDFDTANIHSTTSNTSRLTAPVSGIYEVSAGMFWPNPGTSERGLHIVFDGSKNIDITDEQPSGGALLAQTVDTLYKFNAGDYATILVYQGTAGTLEACGDDSFAWASMHWVSPS